jgi:hypothetical protein
VRSLDSGEGKTETVRFVFHYTKFHRRFHGQLLFSSTTTHRKEYSMNDIISADNSLSFFDVFHVMQMSQSFAMRVPSAKILDLRT